MTADADEAKPPADQNEGAGVPSVTRIAGTVLQFYRASRGFAVSDFIGARVFKNKWPLFRAERGEARSQFYRKYIGDIARYLELSSADIVVLLNAVSVDEALAYLVDAPSKRHFRQRDCFGLLQWLWFQPEARIWIKVLFFSSVSPPPLSSQTFAGPCIALHPTIQRQETIGAASEAHYRRQHPSRPLARLAQEALRRSLLIDETENGMSALKRAVLAAQSEALAALRRQNRHGAPKLAEMLLLFADLAKDDTVARGELEKALHSLKEGSLSDIDRLYRARALYLLGDDKALCGEVAARRRPEWSATDTVRFYLSEAGDEGDGTLALHDLCSHLKFAREKKSAPLLALYLGTAHDLITARQHKGWFPSLANIATTAWLKRIAINTLADLERIRRNEHDALRANLADHGCDGEPTCQAHAKNSAEQILADIERASKAIGFLGPRRGSRPTD